MKGTADVEKWSKTVGRSLASLSESKDVGRAFSKCACTIIRKHGYFVWKKDPSFSINNHVRLWNQQYEDHDSMMTIVSEIHYEPFPEGRSPWEVVLVPNKGDTEADYNYIVVLRVHHSLADGSAVFYLLSAIKDDDEEQIQWFQKLLEVFNGTPQKGYVGHKPNILTQHLMAKKRPKLTPKIIFWITVNALASLFAYLYHFSGCFFHEEQSSLHGPPQSGRKLMATSEPLDLKIFKETAKGCHTTINDVFMTCICGAIKAFNPSRKMTTKLAVMMGGNRPGLLGRQNTLTSLLFDVSLRDESPYQRLQNIAALSSQLKSSPAILGGSLLTLMLFNHLPLPIHKWVLDLMTRACTVGCTNFVMCPFQLRINGDALTGILTFPINVGYMGISFTCVSYNGFIRFSVTMDKAVAIDDSTADQLIKEAIKELHNLHSLTVQQPSMNH